ncbi:hypothetical protein C5167_006472 [Papaver somniferum]|uniref:Damage-control phosphatase ARMT1-like metal-binding domain-containing protein n=1 Tax=Papaver somniferum TaxID=3469 RepID=A0A4Y7JGJ6_PAPSO|nr:hypothetical protein C5167_006472 [Papaver somniferum]
MNNKDTEEVEIEREMEDVVQKKNIVRPQLNLRGAEIQGNYEEKDPTILLPNQSDDISHLALDIGGSLIKLVYFSRHDQDRSKKSPKDTVGSSSFNRRNMLSSSSSGGGRLHFVNFETQKINECLEFISSKQLHLGSSEISSGNSATIKATGGGAFKFADLFKEKLGVSIDKEDEMDALVAGANFLLKAISHEAFTHVGGQKEFVQIDHDDLYPYLLVNIGSGVSIIKVDGDGTFERVSGTNVGGGTFWGLGKLLTKCQSFDELLEMSQRGDIKAVDMFVGDIYGGMDYSKIGLSATNIASSFGKAISENKELDDYRPEDLTLSLLRMISYNIGQVWDQADIFWRFFYSGSCLYHEYYLQCVQLLGEAQAMFLRHEGFLGALGAFLSSEKHGLDDLMPHQLVERFPMGAPYVGGRIHGPPIRDLNEKASTIKIIYWSMILVTEMQKPNRTSGHPKHCKEEVKEHQAGPNGLMTELRSDVAATKKLITWMEKFVQKGTEIIAPVPIVLKGIRGPEGLSHSSSKGDALNVGVLHVVPTLEVFPLLADPKTYWLTILSEVLPDLVDKAVASEGGTDIARRKGDGFAHAFSAHLARLMEEPAAYGKLGLATLLELREDCLREFQFVDAYKTIKQRENEASLVVFPDLLMELDSMTEENRLHSVIEGVLAANIFDWGSRACVDLYHNGSIIEIYRMSRNKMCRPWRVDDFDIFRDRVLGSATEKPKPHRRALLFVDNSGADIVLGMLPLARELLRRGTEVVLVGNSLPALNDVTAMELLEIVTKASKYCDILRKAAEAGGLLMDTMAKSIPSVPLTVIESGCGGPCIDFRQVSSELAAAANDADLIILEGMGRAIHTNFNAHFKCDALKLAMVKNQRLAEKLLKGNIYDCVCRFEPAD